MSAGEILFALCALCCIAGEMAILRSAFRTSKLPLPPGSTRFGEVAWSIVPAVGLAILLFTTVTTLRAQR